MTSKVKFYQNLINDVINGEITLKDVMDILGKEYPLWYSIYNSENKARDAYKRYIDALKILENARIVYEKSVVNEREHRNLYNKWHNAKDRAEARFEEMIKPAWDALRRMGEVEEDIVGDPSYKILQMREFQERRGAQDLQIPVPYTSAERLRVSMGMNVQRKYFSFNNIFERTMKMEHNIMEYVTKPYTKSMLEMTQARVDMEQALKNKETTQIEYEGYVLLSMLGIL